MNDSSQAFSRGGSHWLYAVVAVLAAVGQLMAGYFYLVSGLAAPVWALAFFVVWWLTLTYLGVRLALRKSFWLLLVPLVAMATWIGAMWFGGAFLGWTA